MARIGTYSTYFEVSGGNSPNSYFDSRVYFTLDYSQNKDNGKTTYTLTVYAQRYSSGSDATTLSYNVHYVLAGEESNRTGSWSSSGSGYTLTKLFTITKTVDSNQDGSGKQIGYTAYGQTYNAYKGGVVMYYTPPTVALQSTITSNTSDTSRKSFGEEVTFTITRSNNNYKHDIYYVIGDNRTKIGENVDTSFAYTFPTSLISQFTNTDRPNVRVECETKNGNNQVGVTTNTSAYLTIPNTYVPTISLSLEDAGTTPSSWGIWVKTRSKIKGTITASGVEGSTIQSYSASANGQNFSTTPFTTDVISSSGNITVTASVTDTRNRTVQTTETINVVDYAKPTISKFEMKRCNADGTPNEDGTYARAYITYSIASCNNKNGMSLKVKDIDNDNEKIIAITEYSGNAVSEVFSGISISNYYEFEAKIGDTFETITYAYKISPSSKVISLRAEKDGLTFGQIATEEGFHSYYDATIHGNLEVEGTFSINGEELEIPNVNDAYSESQTDAYSCNYINNMITEMNTYSTTEKWTGMYWIDNKKIYRKVVTGTSDSGYFNINLGISNVDKYIDMKVRVIRSGSFAQNSNTDGYYASNTDNFRYYFATPSSSVVRVSCGSSWPIKPFDYAVIVEYTKTTN